MEVNETQNDVGLKRLRKESGLTQSDLAAKSGLAQQAISDYERNRRTPSLLAGRKIANALDTTLDIVAEAIEEQKQMTG